MTLRKKIGFIFLIIIILYSCSQNDNSNKNDVNRIIQEVDSVKKELDSIRKSTPFMFDLALSLENHNYDSALSLYHQILEVDTNTFWTLLSSERCAGLKQNERKSFMTKSFEFGLNDTLILSYYNSKCGEWGGDSESIKIYLKRGANQDKSYLIADYEKEIYDCYDLERAYDGRKLKYKLIEKRNIIIKSSDEIKIENCIVALVNHKLRSEFPGHAGDFSTVRLINDNDKPKLYIEDYSWNSWKEFHQLKRVLLTR